MYGFFLPCWKNAKATIHVVSRVRHFYPTAPLLLVGNGYYDYTKLCQRYSCNYTLDRALSPMSGKSTQGLYLGSHERFVYFEHLRAACSKSTYLILLEDDVEMRSPIRATPPGDAGGIADDYFGALIQEKMLEELERRGKQRRSGFRIAYRYGFQLAGGSYMRSQAFLQALCLSPPDKVWDELARLNNGFLSGSDAVLFQLLSMAGYEINPWQEASAGVRDFNKSLVTFVHDDKSLYEKALSQDEAALVERIPSDWATI